MHAPIRTVPFFVIVAVAAPGAAGIALLRWPQLFARGRGMPLMYVWSVLDILLITALVAVSGGPRSPFFWLYTLATFFMASSYPPRSQLALLGFTYACYLGLLTSAGAPIQAGDVLVRFAILGVLTFMASFLFGELTRQMQCGCARADDVPRGTGRGFSSARTGNRCLVRLCHRRHLPPIPGRGFSAKRER